MYNDQIENLINLALADGVLTDKEKKVLFKKAEEEGIDLDEFEMVLDAKLHNLKGKNLKDNLIKCPNCGEPISGLVNVCPSCSYVIENKGSNDKIKLQNVVLDIEDDLKELKAIPLPNVFNIVKSNMILFFVTIGLVVLLADFFIIKNGWIGFIGVVIAFYGGMGAKNFKDEEEEKYGKNESSETLFKSLKASFEKNSRIANTYFGTDRNVNNLLTDLNNEIITIESKRKKAKKTAFIIFATFLLLIVLGSFLLSFQSKPQNYTLDGTQRTMTGNIGHSLIIIDKQSNINVQKRETNLGDENKYTIYVNNVNISVSDKDKLKSDWGKLIKGCKKDCVNINAELLLEDENKNPIGVESLNLDYENQGKLIKYLNSEIDNFSLSFSKDYIKDITSLSKAKNYTISIIGIKK